MSRKPHSIPPSPPCLERGWLYPKGRSVWVIESLTREGEVKYQWCWGKPLKYRTLTDAIEVAYTHFRTPHTRDFDADDIECTRLRNVKTEESIPLAALGF